MERIDWKDEESFEVDGAAFKTSYSLRSETGCFHICKPRPHIEAYAELLATFHGGNVVELGVAAGGSAALLVLLAAPQRFIAIERDEHRIPELDALIEAQGLGDRAEIHFGVDQADREVLARLVDEGMGGDPIDLVVDDASHLLRPTRASFETLFPRLRPGGLYCIEDWGWQHLHSVAIARGVQDPEQGDALRAALDRELYDPTSTGHSILKHHIETRFDEASPEAKAEFARQLAARRAVPESPDHDESARAVDAPSPPASPAAEPVPDAEEVVPDAAQPLLALVIQLLLMRAESAQMVEHIEIDANWVRVRRGPAALDPGSFRLADSYTDHLGIVPC